VAEPRGPLVGDDSRVAHRRLRTIVVAGLVAWIVNAVVLWATAAPLGDNEALYARAAQLHVDGEPIPWHYMSKGMLVVADPGMLAGGSERALRIVPLLLGIGFVLAAALFARRMAGVAVAAWLVPVLAASLSIAKRSAELLSDMPSAACLLAGIGILLSELARDDGPRRQVLLVAPLFAAAVYLRYGSVLPIAISGVVALGFYGRAVLRRPARMLAAVGLLVALLVPHALDARATTGSPLGFLLAGNEALHVEYRGEGLVGFIVNNPFTFYGAVTAPLLVLGLLSIVRPRDRRAVALWLIAVVTVIALGLTTVAESRYVFLSQTILLVLGIDVVLRLLAARPPRTRKVLGYVAAAVIAASWLGVLIPSLRIADRRRHNWDGMLTAAAEVRRDAAGAHCRVVCRHTHQVEWYSGCEALLEMPSPGRDPLYVVRDDFGDFQPPVTGLPGHSRAIFERGEVLVLRLEP
jgi:hypothetical protein